MMWGYLEHFSVQKLTTMRCVQAGKKAMKDAVAQYKTNIRMKTAVDLVQMKNECCGSVTYLEWFGNRWISDEYILKNV